MDAKPPVQNGNQQRFQVQVGEEIAWVEVVSLKNKIYAVEFPGREPMFITQIKDKNNKTSWISMPQGEDDLAEKIGQLIRKRHK